MAKTDDESSPEAAGKQASGGIKDWLPLIVTLTVMPAVAYALTLFVLVPQLQAKLGNGGDHATESADAEGHGPVETDGHASSGGDGHSGGHSDAAGSNMADIKKVLVNVKGTGATRYLVSSFALSGSKGNISTMVEQHEPQLRDIAMGILMNLSIDDLSQAEIKNRVKLMLVTSFNNALGGDYIENIYFTEFAVQ